MSKIIDLSVLVKDPLIFKDTQGESYTIPGKFQRNLLSNYQNMQQIFKNQG